MYLYSKNPLSIYSSCVSEMNVTIDINILIMQVLLTNISLESRILLLLLFHLLSIPEYNQLILKDCLPTKWLEKTSIFKGIQRIFCHYNKQVSLFYQRRIQDRRAGGAPLPV